MSVEIRGLAPLFEIFDMPTSVRFYRDVLGFELVTHSPGENLKFGWALLRRDKVELMLNTAYEFDDERPVSPDAGRVRGHGDVGLFIGCPDVDGMCAELRAKGVALRDPVNQSYGMRQICIQDPDGFGICFQWPVQTPQQ